MPTCMWVLLLGACLFLEALGCFLPKSDQAAAQDMGAGKGLGRKTEAIQGWGHI